LRPPPTAGRYALAIALTLVTVLLRWALIPVIGSGTIYITLFPAMVIVAVTFGAGPGLVGNALGIAITERFLFASTGESAYTLSLAVRSALMLLTTFYVGRVGERLRIARRRADAEASAAREAEAALRAQVELLDAARAEVIAREMQRVLRQRRAVLTPVPESSPNWVLRVPRAAGTLVATVGLAVLVGWVAGLDAAKSVLPGLATMKANTAFCFLAAGLALSFRTRPPARLALGSLVCLVAALTLLEYIAHANLGIDELLFRDTGDLHASFPGRMAEATAIGFFLAGASLLLVGRVGRGASVVQQALAAGATLAGAAAVLGYTYNVAQLYKFAGYSSMAVHSAVSFLVLGVGLLVARRDGLCKLLVTPGPGAQLMRRLFPAAVLLPVVLGWLGVAATKARLVEPGLGAGLYAILIVVALVALVFWTAYVVGRTDLARRLSEAQLRSQADLMNHAHEPLFVREQGGVIRSWNRGAESLYGFSAAEAVGQRQPLLLSTQGPEVEEIDRCLRETGRWEGELAHTTRDGRRVLVEARMTSAPADDGRLLALVSERDITERRRDEEQLRLVRTALEAAANGVAITDGEGTLLWVNAAFTRLTGYSREEAIGRTPRLLKSGEQPPSFYENLWTTIMSGAPWQGSLVNRRKDGTLYHEDMTITPVSAASGEVTHFVAIKQDVTKRKETEAALREVDRRKTDFLAMLSHELRNPLAPIRNSLYLLEHGEPGSEKSRRAQTVIERQVLLLTRLVDDLLDVTRISRGKIQLRRERIQLGDLVRHTVEDHHGGFEERRIELRLAVPASPLFIEGDPVRIAQIVGNLLQNALKFTESGGTVTVSLEEDRSRGQGVVKVRDDGAGLAPEMLSRIFEPFIQADTTLDRSKGGLGLGLALARGLTESHGGSIGASSDGPGKGSEFSIRLPLSEAPPASAIAASNAPGAGTGRRVLLIDDNVDAAESLREVLELGGHRVVVASNGPDGLARARAHKPEVVVCDIGLPAMDGYAVARAFRADAALREIRLIALSGYAAAEDLEQSRAAGFEAHLAKPPMLDLLEELISASSLPARGASSPAALTPALSEAAPTSVSRPLAAK
jgi:PAS domain S-box-containing protein